jgi:hypothetical protein
VKSTADEAKLVTDKVEAVGAARKGALFVSGIAGGAFTARSAFVWYWWDAISKLIRSAQ